VRPDHVLAGDFKAAPIFISADSAQLKQVSWNLARNALQAMPDGGRLEVATYPIPGNRVRITFADTGRGMPPEAVEQLFEPFANSTSGGTGLGLSIVYQIIRDHNGSINVRSIEGEGTVITVELPREHRPVAVPAQNGQADAETNRLEHLLHVRSERDEISP
jgi:two-component system sensor histidine kinase PilS (NtrC family)